MNLQFLIILQETEEKLPITNAIIWQIVGFSILMIALSQFFNWKYRISPEDMIDFQERMRLLQEELKLAQSQGDQQKFRELSSELQVLMKELMQKQMYPSCLRTLVFIVILSIVGGIYGEYENILGGLNWFWFYVLLSFLGNMFINMIRKKVKESRGEQDVNVRDSLRVLQQNLMVNRDFYGPSTPSNPNIPPFKNQISNTNPAWKEKIYADSNSESIQTTKESLSEDKTTKLNDTSENGENSSEKSWKSKL